MTYQEIQDQALKLTDEERLQLASVLMQSLQPPAANRATKRQGAAVRLIGIAKTDTPPPSDEEVARILDERLTQKYL